MADPTKLADERCVPCRGGVPKLSGEELQGLSGELPSWTVVEGHHLEKEFRFADYRAALRFTQRVGELAEEQGHHPDLLLTYGRVKVTLWTHKVDGLTRSDFVLAAKVDALPT